MIGFKATSVNVGKAYVMRFLSLHGKCIKYEDSLLASLPIESNVVSSYVAGHSIGDGSTPHIALGTSEANVTE